MIKVRKYRTGGYEVDIIIKNANGTIRIRERRKAPVSGKTAAERWALERESFLLAAPAMEEPEKKQRTLNEFWDDFKVGYLEAERLSPSHQLNFERYYEKLFRKELGSTLVRDIDAKAIVKLKSTLSDKGPKTTNNILGYLRSMLNRAKEWGEIDHVPTFKPIKYQRDEMEFYDFDAFNELVAAAKDTRRCGLDHVLIVLLGGRGGLRAGEMLGLEWNDIDWARNELVLRRSIWKDVTKSLKGKKTRRVPMTPDLVEVLKEYRHLRSPRVLIQADQTPATLEWLNGCMERIQRKAERAVDGKLHILRHTYASHLVMRGVTLKVVQELLGHESITTTMAYAHLAPSAKTEAVAMLFHGDLVETKEKRKSA